MIKSLIVSVESVSGEENWTFESISEQRFTQALKFLERYDHEGSGVVVISEAGEKFEDERAYEFLQRGAK